jgi:hypothetical protein
VARAGTSYELGPPPLKQMTEDFIRAYKTTVDFWAGMSFRNWVGSRAAMSGLTIDLPQTISTASETTLPRWLK